MYIYEELTNRAILYINVRFSRQTSTHPHSRLRQTDPVGDVVAGGHVRVAVAREVTLQLGQLNQLHSHIACRKNRVWAHLLAGEMGPLSPWFLWLLITGWLLLGGAAQRPVAGHQCRGDFGECTSVMNCLLPFLSSRGFAGVGRGGVLLATAWNVLGCGLTGKENII